MKFKIQNSKFKIKEKLDIERLIKILLANRGIQTKKEIEEFLSPKLSNITIQSVGIKRPQLKKAISRIKKAIRNKEQIVVFGDYDVDGICGTAILWETLNTLGAKVMPYIPHRVDEGYGLSVTGIENVILNLFQDPKHESKEMLKQVQHDKKRGLIITVDNGIVANKAVDFAKEKNIDVIITDHHVASTNLPEACAIVHTTKLCGTGVAWALAQELKTQNSKLKTKEEDRHLELVALATVADLVPLKGANRTLLKFGLEALKKTKRIGLSELFKEAGLEKSSIGVYEIGHIIAPRLNAMGRLEYAMDSLRLICTNNQKRAEKLARLLGSTNRQRQDLTLQTVLHAIKKIKNQKSKIKSLLFVSHETYQQGVIGLVAGKMVEEFYKPAIVVSRGKKISKGSARSVSGFNIIEFIRKHSSLLIDTGGHPMAAGFTVETTKLLELQKALEDRAEKLLSQDMLTRSLKIDLEIPLSALDLKIYQEIQELSPFGIGNPEPVFISKNVVVEDMKLVGAEGKHLKIKLACHPEASAEGSRKILRSAQNNKRIIGGIGFGIGEKAKEFHIGDKVDIAYVISQDEWNGNKKLQLKIRDLQRTL